MWIFFACTENNLIGKNDPEAAEDEAGVPDIEVTPTEIAFGEVEWGSEHTQVVTVQNVGTGTLLLESPSLSGVNADVSISALGSSILAAGAKTDLVVTWAANVTMADTLSIGSNDDDEAEVRVPISGTVPTGEIQVSPESYDFGTLAVGASASTVVTVTNVGGGPLTVDRTTFAATDADLFVLDSGGLTLLPATLSPGESTDLIVGYSPSDGSGDEGTLGVFSDDADTPEAGTIFMGKGEEPDPCDGFTQHVKLIITADDAWDGWIDGTEFTAPGQDAWSTIDTLEWDLACGDHALALYATDTGMVIAGVLAAIEVEGTVTFVSGPTDWTMIDTAPPADWTDPAFDDSTWHIPEVCADGSPWGTTPQPLYDLGARWIWWTSNCRDLGEAWLRLNFTVP